MDVDDRSHFAHIQLCVRRIANDRDAVVFSEHFLHLELQESPIRFKWPATVAPKASTPRLMSGSGLA